MKTHSSFRPLILAQVLEIGVETHGKTGSIRSAESGSFFDDRSQDGNVEDVRLELHEEIVFDHAAVGAERKKVNFGILFHGFENFAGLIGGSFENGASEMSFVRVTSESSNDAASIAAPIGSVEAREGGNEIDAAIIADRPGERFDV